MREENLEAEVYGIMTKSNEIYFQLNPESREFTKIISSLHAYIDLCDPNITLDMNLKHPELIFFRELLNTVRNFRFLTISLC